jgi:hypothetical protein
LKLRDLLRINEKLQPFSFIEGRKKFQLLELSGGEIKKIREKKKKKYLVVGPTLELCLFHMPP